MRFRNNEKKHDSPFYYNDIDYLKYSIYRVYPMLCRIILPKKEVKIPLKEVGVSDLKRLFGLTLLKRPLVSADPPHRHIGRPIHPSPPSPLASVHTTKYLRLNDIPYGHTPVHLAPPTSPGPDSLGLRFFSRPGLDFSQNENFSIMLLTDYPLIQANSKNQNNTSASSGRVGEGRCYIRWTH